MNENQNANTEATQELVVSQPQAVVVSDKPKSYAAMILENYKREFLEVNEGMDLDFVRMGNWLKLNKKGVFIDAKDETIAFGDTLDCVICQGEKRFMLWGKKDTPFDGTLICAENSEELARQELYAFLTENPEAAADHSEEDIALRYLAFVIPVDCLKEAAEEGAYPALYLTDFPTGDTFSYADYAKTLFDGKKYKHLGVKKTGVNRVVTRIGVEERKVKSNPKESYLGRTFECLGMFNPAEYGLDSANPTT